MPHWKKPFASNFLSSSDIEGKDLVLTIKEVRQEMCKLSTGDALCNVAHFVEPNWKPMILNVGNSTVVKRFSGNNPDTDYWKMIPVTIYVNPNVRLGKDTVEGLRIRPIQPRIDKKGEIKKAPLTPESPNWAAIVKWAQESEANKPETVWAKYEVTEADKAIFMQQIEEVKE